MKPTSAQMLRHLVRRFGLLVLLTLLGAIAGGAYGALKTPTYVAQAYVVVTGQPGEPATAVNFAQAFGRIVTTGPVADKAAAALGSSEDLKQVTTRRSSRSPRPVPRPGAPPPSPTPSRRRSSTWATAAPARPA